MTSALFSSWSQVNLTRLFIMIRRFVISPLGYITSPVTGGSLRVHQGPLIVYAQLTKCVNSLKSKVVTP